MFLDLMQLMLTTLLCWIGALTLLNWIIFPKRFWSAVHNLVAHPLLVTGSKWADRFHDWTADKM